MSDCYKTSNNKYFDCPPRMSDGRHFTDYRPNCYIQNLIKSENGINNSLQYRQFLTHNADKIMQENRKYACDKNCCGPCQSPYDVGTMLPEQTLVKCDKNLCTVNEADANGLGQGRVYSDTPLHCSNWGETLPKIKSNNKCTPDRDNFNYYPSSANYEDMTRLTSPSGGKALTGGDNSVYH